MLRAYIVAVLSVLMMSLAVVKADIAPPYREYHAGFDIDEGEPYPIVSSVKPASPAEKAGVKKGDVLLALNGTYARTKVPFYFFAKGLRGPLGSIVSIVVLRNEDRVVVIEMPRTIATR